MVSPQVSKKYFWCIKHWKLFKTHWEVLRLCCIEVPNHHKKPSLQKHPSVEISWALYKMYWMTFQLITIYVICCICCQRYYNVNVLQFYHYPSKYFTTINYFLARLLGHWCPFSHKVLHDCTNVSCSNQCTCHYLTIK